MFPFGCAISKNDKFRYDNEGHMIYWKMGTYSYDIIFDIDSARERFYEKRIYGAEVDIEYDEFGHICHKSYSNGFEVWMKWRNKSSLHPYYMRTTDGYEALYDKNGKIMRVIWDRHIEKK